jgi:ABC-type amino acid transport system permease subunit
LAVLLLLLLDRGMYTPAPVWETAAWATQVLPTTLVAVATTIALQQQRRRRLRQQCPCLRLCCRPAVAGQQQQQQGLQLRQQEAIMS